MYVELLTTAIDPKSSATAHPSFPQIIQELTGDEARILSYLAVNGFDVKIDFYDGSNGIDIIDSWTLLAENAACQFPERYDFYLENMTRLSILDSIEARHEEDISPIYRDKHETLKQHPTTIEIRKRIEEKITSNILIGHVPIRLSKYGRLLSSACGVTPSKKSDR